MPKFSKPDASAIPSEARDGPVVKAGRWPQVDDRNADRAGAGAAHMITVEPSGLPMLRSDRRRASHFDGKNHRRHEEIGTDRGQDAVT